MTSDPGRLACPLPRCRAVNSATAETCQACGAPLRAWARLRAHPAKLFNAGLQEARSGRTATARDHFAAVVHWCPGDAEARSALALACLLLDDPEEARDHWHQVLTRRPNDTTALKGLAHLAQLDSRTSTPEPTSTPAPETETETGVTESPESPEPPRTPQTPETGQKEPAASE
ncbi:MULTISPECIES: tetratricopeptide repeat protein [unclassified Streptomyces]|uniref:tetratricopeptide repeat protein n=1 Tax=unclassified Streptomyces TaxID=2593676 RepID=UPI0036EDDE19